MNANKTFLMASVVALLMIIMHISYDSIALRKQMVVAHDPSETKSDGALHKGKSQSASRISASPNNTTAMKFESSEARQEVQPDVNYDYSHNAELSQQTMHTQQIEVSDSVAPEGYSEDTLNALGNSLSDNGFKEEAIAAYKQAIQNHSGDIASSLIAIGDMVINDRSDIEEFYEYSLSIINRYPHDTFLYESLGEFFREKGEYQLILRLLEIGLQHNSDNKNYLIFYNNFIDFKSRYQQLAVTEHDQAIKDDIGDIATSLIAIGKIVTEGGNNWDEFYEYSLSVASRYPTDNIYQSIADFFKDNGAHELGLQLIEAGLLEHNNDPDYLTYYIHYKQSVDSIDQLISE